MQWMLLLSFFDRWAGASTINEIKMEPPVGGGVGMGRFKDSRFVPKYSSYVQFPFHSYFLGRVIFPVTGTDSHRNK